MDKIYKAAIVVIGNEILSGRTQDKNINYIALKLAEIGVRLVEVRIIPDVEEKIISTVLSLKAEVDYVFTCGGIGPTHDDITAQCVAKAFDVPLEINSQAYAILEKHYGQGEFTPARQKMAMMPRGASLIPNPVSAAPGFIIHDVYVMAGVPRIMQAMMDHVATSLKGGAVMLSRTVSAQVAESKIAQGLAEIQEQAPNIEIGSYPYFKDGQFGVSVVLRATKEDALDSAAAKVQSLLDQISEVK